VCSSDSNSKFSEEFEQDLDVVKKLHFNHLRGIDDEEILGKYTYSLLRCAYRYKHWRFREESEVRIVAIPYASKTKSFVILRKQKV